MTWKINPAILAREGPDHRRLWAVRFLMRYEDRLQPQTNGTGFLVARAALGMKRGQTLAEAGILVEECES